MLIKFVPGYEFILKNGARVSWEVLPWQLEAEQDATPRYSVPPFGAASPGMDMLNPIMSNMSWRIAQF